MFSELSWCQNRNRKAKSLKESEASAKSLCKYLSKPQNPVSSTENLVTKFSSLFDVAQNEPKVSEKDNNSKGQELQLPECRDSLQTETGIHKIATNLADETRQSQTCNCNSFIGRASKWWPQLGGCYSFISLYMAYAS